MEAEFWYKKWADDQIGFHEAEPHPVLKRQWDALDLKAAPRVFVPLCGKSHDMEWLRRRGCEVVGIELSPIAVEAFFVEHGLAPQRTRLGALTRYRADGYTLFCGDFFTLDAPALGPVDAIYDRAALIALPEVLRAEYVAHLGTLAPSKTEMLLITVDYDRDIITPPPFVVEIPELDSVYAADWTRRSLATSDALVKGHPARESAHRLTRK